MPPRRPRLPSFLAGGVLGGVLVIVAPHARRKRAAPGPVGLQAFASAPCFDLPPEAAEPGGRPSASAMPPADAAD